MHDENAQLRNKILNHFSVSPSDDSILVSENKSNPPEIVGRVDNLNALAAHEQRLRKQSAGVEETVEITKPAKENIVLEDTSELIEKVMEYKNSDDDKLTETRNKVKSNCLDLDLMESMFFPGPK